MTTEVFEEDYRRTSMYYTSKLAHEIYVRLAKKEVNFAEIDPVFIQLIAMVLYIIVNECFLKDVSSIVRRRKLFFNSPAQGRVADEVRLLVIVREAIRNVTGKRLRFSNFNAMSIKDALIESIADMNDNEVEATAREHLMLEV